MRFTSKIWAAAGVIALAAAVACTPSAPGGAGGRVVSAGIQAGMFTPYTITVPEGWADSRKTDESGPYDALTLVKGEYSILIAQAGSGIEACIFGGAPTPTGEAQLWGEYATGVEIKGTSPQLMRGTTGGQTHIICEKKGDGYNSVTSFGDIGYTTPASADPATLAEMDAMIASLKH